MPEIEPATDCRFADNLWHGRVAIEENVAIARDTYRVRFPCPEIARSIVPGQFVMLRFAGDELPLLGRPLALYDTVVSTSDNAVGGEAVGIDIVYLVVGKLTGKLAAAKAGTPLEVWGPLGNGFAPVTASHLVMVAGGIGQTPFLALAREHLCGRRYGQPSRPAAPCQRVTLLYGARSADLLAGVEDFQRLGVDVRTSTDDGTAGHHGFVTELLARLIEEVAESAAPNNSSAIHIACCGPEPMMAAVAEIALRHGIPCQVSLETPMACGLGICFSCVARIRQADGAWDYRRTCVEGPVFRAEQVVF